MKVVGSRMLPALHSYASVDEDSSDNSSNGVVLMSSEPIPARLLKERHIRLIGDKKKGHNSDHPSHESTTSDSDNKDISISNGETRLIFNNHTGLLERATRCIPHPHPSSSSYTSSKSDNSAYDKSGRDSDVKTQCITTRMVQDYGYYIGYTGYSTSKHHSSSSSSEHCTADLRDPHAQNAKPSVSCAHESAEESTQASGAYVCMHKMCIVYGLRYTLLVSEHM